MNLPVWTWAPSSVLSCRFVAYSLACVVAERLRLFAARPFGFPTRFVLAPSCDLSVDAQSIYSEWVLSGEGDLGLAMQLLQKAVDVDTTFRLALSDLA